MPRFFIDPPAGTTVTLTGDSALLERCAFIPLMTECRATLVSDRVRMAADDYHPLRIYGGIRSLRYMYSDAEWTAYVRRAGGTLDYTAKN